MKYSQLFGKTIRDVPKDEESVNAQLLIRAGFIAKEVAGVYAFLPLGLRVLTKIENIVREEMNAVGGQELLLPTLHAKSHWQTTGRWDTMDALFKLQSRHGYEYGVGPTHEEVLTPIAATTIASYRDLPIAVYQIQTKFRDEPRAKAGLLRGREFRMKDLYSFHANKEDLDKYYDQVLEAYKKTYRRLELDAFLTEALGGTFSKYSHEFQFMTKAGEDMIFQCESCGLCQNREMMSEKLQQVQEDSVVVCPECKKKSLRIKRGVEVGNIFKLGTRFSEPFDLFFIDKDGRSKPVIMGCYGIGTSRVMGAIVEGSHDDKGIIWPGSVAPFSFHLTSLDVEDEKVQQAADGLYAKLLESGQDVLYDDRQERAGVKFADADLIGIPTRVVISKKTLKEGKVEVKRRSEEDSTLVDPRTLLIQ